jgi:hypothetical protein
MGGMAGVLCRPYIEQEIDRKRKEKKKKKKEKRKRDT